MKLHSTHPDQQQPQEPASLCATDLASFSPGHSRGSVLFWSKEDFATRVFCFDFVWYFSPLSATKPYISPRQEDRTTNSCVVLILC